MAIRINTSDVAGLVSQVQEKWRSMAHGQPLSYTFLDEEYNKQYKTDQRTAKLSLIFSILAILIACLGLFGIVSYAAQHRIKEIGIRKVLGAAVFDIFGMLSMDFIKLVLAATIIAAPISWWLMHVWLQDFAYRIPISWWMFVLVGAAALFIALATLSYQTIKAAVANPVESLRVE
jgi:putative ABC transport system permease protein